MKSFKTFVTESTKVTLYRGHGKGSDTKFMTWWSTDKELATGYAKARENGKVDSKTFNLKSVLNLSHDSFKLNPTSLAGMAIKGADRSKLDMDVARSEMKVFKDFFGNNELKTMEYWKDNKSKESIVRFLKVFGYDAVSIKEDGISTYGIFEG
ncbi:MAG: hypothetical protein HOK52_14675 [Candidatus Marinimicrobia bacterium]|jgi:hypothetical protein|nr:hypothetical protein [Candidatus Neomarinimicrobiota bacterium]